MSDLQLALKTEYFNQILSGEKTEEYRLFTAYWCQRLDGRHYENLILTLGYPKGGGVEGVTRLTLPYRGYSMKFIEHKHFGSDAVEVYAIKLTDA